MAGTEDLYEILQLHPSAHQDVIDAAYQRLASLYHPVADPSPETAEKLAAVSQAYAVLGDTEKRAAYDQSRETPRNVPSAEAAGETPETATPKPRPRRRTKQSDLDYITIGSSKEDVARIQGPPSESHSDDSYEDETWGWGSGDTFCSVSFNKSGRVEKWMNRGDLKIRMIPGPNVTTSAFISIGSHKDDVVRLQGTPYHITTPFRLTRAEKQRRRQDEREYREIMREIGKKDYDPISNADDDDSDLETWHFPGGIVEFSVSTGRVTAWDNRDGSLSVQGVSPETEAARAERRRSESTTPTPTRGQASSTAQGCGSLLAVLGLFAAAVVAAVFLA